jgi:hypothetical protein
LSIRIHALLRLRGADWLIVDAQYDEQGNATRKKWGQD